MQNPTKKVKVFGGAIFVAVLATVTYPYLQGLPDLFTQKEEQLVVDLEPIDPQLERGFILGSDDEFFIRRNGDKDGDGLLDWEEELWRTNPEDSDTDGDGTIDGVEVKKNRNPLVAGPADFIISGSTADFLLAQRESGPQPGNLSDQLSQGLFTTYVDGKEGKSSGPEQAEQIVDLAEKALAGVVFQEFFIASSFKTTPLGDLVAIKKYANTFAQAQITLLENLVDADGSVTGRETFVSTIYRNHARALGEMTVPTQLLDNHVLLANTYANLGANLYSVEEYDLDPAKAIFSLQQYDVLRVDIETLITLFPPFFRNNGIVFNDNEPGILWNQF